MTDEKRDQAIKFLGIAVAGATGLGRAAKGDDLRNIANVIADSISRAAILLGLEDAIEEVASGLRDRMA